MEKLLSTREVAQLLGVNEKMVYTLITEKGLPATKITGKWLFPAHLVEQWVESRTINFPSRQESLTPHPGLLLVAGSDDILFERALSLFMRLNADHVAMFGAMGSLGGLKALRHGWCQMATSHLAEEDGQDYNFSFAASELETLPAVVNFCRREQGLVVARDNPHKIVDCTDIGPKDLVVVNRPLGTSTRMLFDRELQRAGLQASRVKGYGNEVPRHLDVGMEILAGRADVGLSIRAVASLLNLDFIPMKWERYDLLIPKDYFFDKGVQLFLGMLHEVEFRSLAEDLPGYDLDLAGKMLYPRENAPSPA
jgi:putative molybdopterin biosynthesis protein